MIYRDSDNTIREIEFSIPDSPVPSPRPRFSHGRAYMPAKYKGYKEIVGLIAKRTMAGGMPLEGQVKVQMSFFQYVPKEMKKIDRYAAVYGGLRPTAKTGDIDNLVKTYTDAIIGICYKDDAQIVELNAGRWYAFNGKPSTLIRITRLD